MTITQTVEIPENRRVHFDFEVPREVPTGRAQVEFKVIPFVKKDEQSSKLVPKEGKGKFSKEELDEMLKDCPHTRALIGILDGLVPSDITIEQIRDERLAKHLK